MKQHSRSIANALGRDTVHPFPARMAASVAMKAISRTRNRLRILDPMMGSGTVVALARANGHLAYGVDIDPLAVLIADVWTSAVDKQSVRLKAEGVLKAARKHALNLALRDAYPAGADKETKKFVRYWFDGRARRQLTALSASIRSCRDASARKVLWCAFSRLIISKQAGASLALDLAHSRPHKHFSRAPREPFDWFTMSVEAVLANCLDKRDCDRGPSAQVTLGDARQLRCKSKSIDLVLTSPPYLNAIDYLRCSKFSLVWMRLSTSDIRRIRGLSIGSERGMKACDIDDRCTKIMKNLRINSRLKARHKGILRTFIEDMHSVLREIHRVLVDDGKVIFVVGENAVRGVYIRTAKILRLLGEDVGLSFVGVSSRTLPPNRRYLPPPNKDKGTINLRMTKEVVVTFRK